MSTQENIVSLPAHNTLSRDGWRSHYDRWREGGQSRAAYCRAAGLNAARFYYYCRVFSIDEQANASGHGECTPASSAFLPLTLAPEPRSALRLQVADVTLSCEGAVSAEQLSAWIRAIRSAL